ncbi:MAG: hypothetical protein LC121_07585 [Anaerolineae bacterium]|nr:hypothetical protein [Anaerolineae bacterium]
MSLEQLSDSVGFSPAWWSNHFRIYNLKAHSTSHRNPGYASRRLFLIANERAFASIENEETAYWFGFIWADGNPTNSGLCVRLKLDDREHLEKLRSFLGTDVKVCELPAPYLGVSKQASLEVHSRALVDDLRMLELIPRRSEQNLSPPSLAHALLPDFFRGLIDGDGCLSRDKRQDEKEHAFFLSGWRLGLAGSNAIVRSFGQFVSTLIGDHFTIDRNGTNPKNRKLSIHGPAAILVCKQLYEKGGPALSRKADVARLLCKYYRKATKLGLEIYDYEERMVFHSRSKAIQDLGPDFLLELEKIRSRR